MEGYRYASVCVMAIIGIVWKLPCAIEECLALGLDGVRGIVADSKAYSRRTLG